MSGACVVRHCMPSLQARLAIMKVSDLHRCCMSCGVNILRDPV